MCLSTPDIPEPPDPPAAPPPPTKKVKKLQKAGGRLTKSASKKMGVGSLTIKRPTVGTGVSGGTGANYS